MEIIEKIREANYVIIGVTFLLFLIGLVGLSSIAIHQEGTIQSSSFLKQTLFVLPGIGLFIFTFYLPKSFYHKSAYWVYGFILLMILFPFIGEKIAYVLSGGDTDVTKELLEENILKLEKDAIYNLMKENLTLERLEHVLETGKYLRN